MGFSARGLPDWRRGEEYEPLQLAPPEAFAWEWLRRDDQYRAAAAHPPSPASGAVTAEPRALAWGLHALEDPALPFPLARPVWTAEAIGAVLPVEAVPAGPGCAGIDFADHRRLLRLVRSERAEHVLLSDGISALRIDVVKGTIFAGPVDLRLRLVGLDGIEPAIVVLLGLAALSATGMLPPPAAPPPNTVRRRILELRAYDALAAGATQREIARTLLNVEAGAARWRIEHPSLRSRGQRLARNARTMGRLGHGKMLMVARRDAQRRGRLLPGRR